MPGNFFDKPHGLHPTPSACFPPKCKKKGVCNNTANFLMSVTAIPIFAGTIISVYAEDTTLPLNQPIAMTWSFPLLNGTKPATIPNGLSTNFTLFAGFLTGTFVATADFKWSNDCKEHREIPYTIEAPPPP